MSKMIRTQLSRNHDRKSFDCGVEALNEFLQKTARRQDERSLVRTKVFVDADQPTRIQAYYSTAPCEIEPPPGVTGWKNYPHPIPALRLTRLACDRHYQGQGLGELALVSAIRDAVAIEQHYTAIGGLIVDAKDDSAVRFYEKYGFHRIEEDGYQLFLPINECKSIASEIDEDASDTSA